MLKAKRVSTSNESLLRIDGSSWAGIAARWVELVPSPVGMATGVSPLMGRSQGHGRIERVEVQATHNGDTLNFRLSWRDPKRDDRLEDLDRFVDAAAIVFPLLEDANPLTMGDPERPINAWLWRGDREEPFDVIARGYSTSERRAAGSSGLAVRARHRDDTWSVIFQRPLRLESAPEGAEFTQFAPGQSSKIAVAIWEGSNAERAGQKAISGGFVDLALDG